MKGGWSRCGSEVAPARADKGLGDPIVPVRFSDAVTRGVDTDAQALQECRQGRDGLVHATGVEYAEQSASSTGSRPAANRMILGRLNEHAMP